MTRRNKGNNRQRPIQNTSKSPPSATTPSATNSSAVNRGKLVTIFLEELAKPSLYLATAALAVSVVSCDISKNTSDRSKEQLAIRVYRQYGTEVYFPDFGMPAFREKWIADITNLSESGITIYPPNFLPIDTISHATSELLPPFKPGQEPPKPIYIEPRKTYRIPGDAVVQIPPIAASAFTTSYKSATFENWQAFTKAHNMNDLGQPMNSGGNLVMEVLVKAIDGKQFFGEGYWYPKAEPEMQ
jgi:hypothetical protein